MRPRKCRHIRHVPPARFFKPQGIPMRELEILQLKNEELEALLLADYQGLQQAEAAAMMNISRPTFSRILSSARKTVAEALTQGQALRIEEGDFKYVKDKDTTK